MPAAISWCSNWQKLARLWLTLFLMLATVSSGFAFMNNRNLRDSSCFQQGARNETKRNHIRKNHHGHALSNADQDDESNTSAVSAMICTSRRQTLVTSVTAGITALLPSRIVSAQEQQTQAIKEPSPLQRVVLPLEYIPTLQAYVVKYFLFGQAFRAIVDTGSPFLTVPSYCQPYRNQKMFWGCYQPERTLDSGYENTIEGFDNNYGTVVWRKAAFSFFDAKEEEEAGQFVVFGVLSQELLDGSGGVFFGLIQETDQWIRPSFLSQTGYTSFCIDLRHGSNDERTTDGNEKSSSISPSLTLSHQPMINESEKNFIRLVRDLKTKYGAPVVHYTAKASKFLVNGLPFITISPKKPLYVIFDTGVSGMIVSPELLDARYQQARQNREKSLWGGVEVSFASSGGGDEVTLCAQKPITTPLGNTPWKGFRGNLIAIGLAFLDGHAMTVDINDGKVLFEDG